MATFTVNVEAYPASGVTNLEIEEHTTLLGWVTVLDTSDVGTFPNYTTAYSVTATSDSRKFRCRWTVDGVQTRWFEPLSLSAAPTTEQEERIKLAIIGKTVRLLVLPEAPFGSYGELSEYGMAAVRPDYQPSEHLFGLRMKDLDISSVEVEVEDVIRAGFSEAEFPAARQADVTAAITAATDWVQEYLEGPGLA